MPHAGEPGQQNAQPVTFGPSSRFEFACDSQRCEIKSDWARRLFTARWRSRFHLRIHDRSGCSKSPTFPSGWYVLPGAVTYGASRSPCRAAGYSERMPMRTGAVQPWRCRRGRSGKTKDVRF